jgi:alpha-amylase/alpha-mannosidase (GH57 family)
MRRIVPLLIALALVVAACTPSESGDTTTSEAPAATTTTTVPGDDSLDSDGFYVNLIWHQHQPLYPKDENGVVTRPWVRVHATKDYYDMAAMVLDYPDLRLTFNLTPVLLLQLEDIVNGTRDSYWVHTEVPAADLTDDEKTFIEARFFDVNPKIIDRFPRFRELRDIRDAGGTYSVDDIRDLQVLFNLAWTDPVFLAEEPLAALVEKGEGFAEGDKAVVLDKHLEIVSEVVSIHRELWDAGQIEVATTPLAHPILPLIGDTDQALAGDSSAIMPANRFRELTDAVEQVVRGLDEAERIIGRRPVGMWPGEGAVSQLVTPIWAGQGVAWVATGEHVLGETLGIGSFTRDANGTVEEAEILYQPYTAEHSRNPRLPMFFRDVELADRIGFEYSGTSGGAAADDFMGRLANIRDQLDAQGVEGPKVVTIVVDGENAWEHYDNDGKDFLNALYTELTTTDWVQTVTPSQLVAAFGDSFEPLPDIFPASWFQPNFATWIGETEEARAWDYLYQARRDLKRAEAEGTDTAEAFSSLLFAEGSDWFWWYGSDQESGDDGYFDAAFRELLGQMYDALGVDRPGYVRIPIIPASAVDPDRTPEGLLSPSVMDPTDPAWDSAGIISGPNEIRWAFDSKNLYLRIADLGDSVADVYLGVPSANQTRGLTVGVPREADQQVVGFEASHVILFSNGNAFGPVVPPPVDGTDVETDILFEGAPIQPSSVTDGYGMVAVPLGSLGAIGVGDRISIRVFIDEASGEGPIPSDGRIAVVVPDVSNTEIVFRVEDPLGDDHGPGTYTYPTDMVFAPGAYDLTAFAVGLSGDEIVFDFTVASPITNPWDSPVGLSVQTFDVYIDVDPGSATGARRMIDGRNTALVPEDGWERALTVEGWESALVLVFGDKGRVVVRMVRELFPAGDPSTWGYAVAVMSQEGFPSSGVRRIRDVEMSAQQWRIGGGDGSLNGTRILDLLWPAEGEQELMLTPAVPITSGDPNEFLPDDFGQTKVLILP